MPEGAADPATEPQVLASAGKSSERKFLRALRCARRTQANGAPATALPNSAVARAVAAAGPAVLLLAAILPSLRPTVAVLLALGWIALWRAHRPEAIAWAAALPLGLTLAWPWILGADAPIGEVACQDPLSVIAVRRVLLAGGVLGLIAALAIAHRSSADELGLRRPLPAEAAIAAGGCLALVVGGLVIGPLVARPFFGALDFPVPPAALLPAVLFGVANGVAEEVTYRGALQGWLGRIAPAWLAIGYQGLVFGMVHAGPEVVALLPLHVALLTTCGVGAGLIRRCTGSLAIPIGVHVGADIALYVGLACRTVA